MLFDFLTTAEKAELKALEIRLRGGDEEAIGRWSELCLKLAMAIASMLRRKGEGYPQDADDLSQEATIRGWLIGKELLNGEREEIGNPAHFLCKVMSARMRRLLKMPKGKVFEQWDGVEPAAGDRNLPKLADRLVSKEVAEDILVVCKNEGERKLIRYMAVRPNVGKAATHFRRTERSIKRSLNLICDRYEARLVADDRQAPLGVKAQWPTTVAAVEKVTLAPEPATPASEQELALAT